MKNIPIFRAKKIDKDEYVEGFLIKSFGAYYIANDKASKICDSEGGTVLGYDISEEYADAFEIDPTTIAIHFPDMLDSQGNKIFASLQEDGKGGDKTDYGKVMIFDSIETIPYFESWGNYTVTGIQE